MKALAAAAGKPSTPRTGKNSMHVLPMLTPAALARNFAALAACTLTVVSRPLAAAPGATTVPAPAPSAGPAPAHGPDCSWNFYTEPSLLFGAARIDGGGTVDVLRGRVNLGVRWHLCDATPLIVRHRLRLAAFVEAGDSAIGGYFLVGPEAEYDHPMGSHWRLGGRVALGLGDVRTLSVGPRVRRGPVALGVDLVYSTRGLVGTSYQESAFGALGTIGLGGKLGVVWLGLTGLLAVGLVAAFAASG